MILIALKISLIITAIYSVTREGMIAHPIRTRIKTFLDKKIGQQVSEIITKPLFECLVCMSSFWTLVLMWFWIDVSIYSSVYVLLLILTVSGINSIINHFIKHEE